MPISIDGMLWDVAVAAGFFTSVGFIMTVGGAGIITKRLRLW